MAAKKKTSRKKKMPAYKPKRVKDPLKTPVKPGGGKPHGPRRRR